MIERLVAHESATPPEPMAGPSHPIRKVTRQVAFDGGWDSERAKKVADLFDGMAATWASTLGDPSKAAPLTDALDRGGLAASVGGPNRRWLELGSGTGAGTSVLSGCVGSLTAFDIAGEMLAEASADLAPRVQGDASILPFADNTFDAVIMLNMFLFPAEVDRVLRPGGSVVWINSLGDQTPIHLPADDVALALPGEWHGRTADAGTGFWAVLQRSE